MRANVGLGFRPSLRYSVGIKDASGGRMQLRTQRFAAVIENGKFTTLNVDEAGLDSSAAEVILDALKVSA